MSLSARIMNLKYSATPIPTDGHALLGYQLGHRDARHAAAELAAEADAIRDELVSALESAAPQLIGPARLAALAALARAKGQA